MDAYDVCIVGGGVAGLTAGTFTARAGLDTVVVDDEGSILRRNAHLENFPGFPLGVDARRLLERLTVQAERAGVSFVDGRVDRVSAVDSTIGFDVRIDPDHAAGMDDGDDAESGTATADEDGVATAMDDRLAVRAERVVAASWSDASYLPDAVTTESRGSKTIVHVDDEGRSAVDGIYAAGRIADQYHQAIVCAGHGGTVGVTVIHDSDRDFYHDWVVPEGYFTDRGRPVPPGCEEITSDERERRDQAARDANAIYTTALDADPVTHPSLLDED